MNSLAGAFSCCWDKMKAALFGVVESDSCLVNITGVVAGIIVVAITLIVMCKGRRRQGVPPQATGGTCISGDTLQKVFRWLQDTDACSDWRNVGRELDLREHIFDIIIKDNPLDTKEQCYKMLLKWERSKAGQATLEHLVAALRRCDLNKVAEDLLQAYHSLSSPDLQREQQIGRELKDWYILSLSRLHPIPWCQWVESDFTHMFTNLEIVEGRKHQRPLQSLSQPGLRNPARTQGPSSSQTVDTEESLARLLWGSDRRTVTFIEGTAGIGKSCLCRRLLLSWATDYLALLTEKFKLVFILEARTLMGSLKECVTRQLFAEDFCLGTNEIYTCITECQEKCLFIIDGVDELNSKGEQVIQDLVEGRWFRRANVLLTGRPESAEKYIKYVDIHLQITGFTWENTKLYIRKFFYDNQAQVRDKLVDRIRQDANLQELSRTPFTTLLICLLAEDSDGEIPNSLNDILRDIIHLTARRYVSRPKATPREGVTAEAILVAASHVAYKGETTDTVVFLECDLETICTHMSHHLLLSGLLNRDFILSRLHTNGCCYFPHKSIQDFLCARYLASLDVDSLRTTMAQYPGFCENPTLCKMLLNMVQDQADKYVAAIAFYWSQGYYSKCNEEVVRSALTVTDSGTLDTIIGVFCQYLSAHDLVHILVVPGDVRLYNQIVCRMGLVPVIMLRGWWRGQNKLWMGVSDSLTTKRWPPYSGPTPGPVWEHAQCVDLPFKCGTPLLDTRMSDDIWQDLTLPWVLAPSPLHAIKLTKHPVRINVLCVCVIPTAECVTHLSSLIDRTRSSDLIVSILKPRVVTYEDSMYLRVLGICKRAHSNPVRVSSCTVVTEVGTDKSGFRNIENRYQLSTSPLHMQYNRHCPY